MAVTAVIEIEYDTDSEEEARAFALADAEHLFQQERVLAVAGDTKDHYLRDSQVHLPITERYLQG